MQACYKLAMWFDEGKVIPGYIYKQGRPFIAKLIGLKTDIVTSHQSFRYIYNNTGSDLINLINQPDGWVYLQIAIAKAKEEISGETT